MWKGYVIGKNNGGKRDHVVAEAFESRDHRSQADMPMGNE
jgi:hypothetical protein